MDAEVIPVKFDKVIQSKAYTCIVLSAEEKKFGIYASSSVGKIMQRYLTNSEKPRPMTHDLIQMIFRGYDIKIRQIVIKDLEDTVYFARIFFEQKMDGILHILEMDARPSDCITLALRQKAPLFCTRDVLNRVVPMIEE